MVRRAPAADAAELLNDEWFQNTFLLVDFAGSAKELGNALFPQATSEFTVDFPPMSINRSGLVPLMHIVDQLKALVVILSLPEASMPEFPMGLLKLKKLKKLNLSKNNISSIPDAISKLPSLVEFDISDKDG